jgi:mRNA interferase RelE/StbE
LAQNIENIKCHALAGALSGLCKLRAGDYRILYQIVRDERLIIIHAIAHRSIVYKRR